MPNESNPFRPPSRMSMEDAIRVLSIDDVPFMVEHPDNFGGTYMTQPSPWVMPPLEDEPDYDAAVVTYEDEIEDEYECERCSYSSTNEDYFYRPHSDAADWAGHYGDLLCENCMDSINEGYDESCDYDEDYGRDDEASHETEIVVNEPDEPSTDDADPILLVPSITGKRQARLVSFEQEVARGGRAVALALYQGGFTSTDYIQGYHSGPSSSGDFCYVEQDSSVDAEIIWPKLKLHQRATATRFAEGIGVVRGMIAEGQVKLDMHCGGHMHVDAKGLTMRNALSLYVLWNHVEDVMFRIGAANWSAHRTQVAYENYAPATRKGLSLGREVWNHMQYDRGALNLSNLISARSRCTCGATISGMWDECTCNMRKQTVEFRVWNTTANLRKINAYSALCVAMVEYARLHDMSAAEFPERGWTQSRAADKAHVEDPLRFVMEDLPLTAHERDNVQYCVDRCSLAEVL